LLGQAAESFGLPAVNGAKLLVDAFNKGAAPFAPFAPCAPSTPSTPLLSRYWGIFFAMLTLALSVVTYGLLMKLDMLGGSVRQAMDINFVLAAFCGGLGVVRSFQTPQLYGELSALDNMRVANACHHQRLGFWQPAHRPQAVQRAKQLLERFRLAQHQSRRVAELPRGCAQAAGHR
jgi:hypothetical protein